MTLSDDKMLRFSFIGAGNVTYRLSMALMERGYAIDALFNRSPEKADKIALMLNRNGSKAFRADTVAEVLHSDVVIVAVTDTAVGSVVMQLEEAVSRLVSEGVDPCDLPVVLHTSGAVDISVFDPLTAIGCRCGVLYPVMTLRKNKNVEFRDVPMLLESTDPSVDELLEGIASALGSEHCFYSSRERLKMHVAAVFTCNFVNYILSLAFPIIGRDHPLLLPSTIESVRNCYLHNPQAALTGPAKRGDMETIQKHLDLLEELGLEDQLEVYELFTKRIMERNKNGF